VFFIMPEFNGFFKLIKSKEIQCRFDELKSYIKKRWRLPRSLRDLAMTFLQYEMTILLRSSQQQSPY